MKASSADESYRHPRPGHAKAPRKGRVHRGGRGRGVGQVRGPCACFGQRRCRGRSWQSECVWIWMWIWIWRSEYMWIWIWTWIR